MHDIARLTWVTFKTRPSNGNTRRNRPGIVREHVQALKDDAAFEATKLTEFKEGDEIA